MQNECPANPESVRQTNRFTMKVLGIGITAAGAVISALGMLSDEYWAIPVAVGAVIVLTGFILLLKSRK